MKTWVIIGSIIGASLLGSYFLFGTRTINSVTKSAQQLPVAADKDKLSVPPDFTTLWLTDFKGDRVLGLNRAGDVVWQQSMVAPPIPPSGYATHTEYVTLAPNGNLIISDGEGMMIQEIDRQTHHLVWQYGVKDKQGASRGYLHQPDKAFKFNDHEVVVNDGNNRRVIVIDQKTNDIVWQYGHTLQMGTAPGFLRGNTYVLPIDGGQKILITDTLEKNIMLIDRATQHIDWQWRKPDAKWMQHVSLTLQNTFILEDRQKNDVFEVNRDGQILWDLTTLADGQSLHYPTDAIKLGNGNVLIAEAGRSRVIEVNPHTREIVKTYPNVGFVTTIAIDQNGV